MDAEHSRRFGHVAVALALLRWVQTVGIDPAFIDPGKPWKNGTDESFNGKFREECLNLQWFRNRLDAKIGIERWRRHYNEEQPHMYSSEADSTYHGLLVSFVQRPSRWGYIRASYTLSKAMNNVGEFFFSGPIDPFDLMEDWGRADSDRRHMFSMTAMVQASTEPATTTWQRLSHGFQLSALVQAYSAAPFNITSGVTTIQGTAGRPVVDGEFIPRNSGVGDEFFSLGLRLSRTFTTGTSVQIEALAEVFNVTNTFRADRQPSTQRRDTSSRASAARCGCRRSSWTSRA